MRDVRIDNINIDNIINENEIETILAEDIDFSGILSFKKPLMIKGKFKGEINASSDLYVGEKALIQAKIEANKVSAKGKIIGNVLAHSRVELFSTAAVDGDLTTPDLVVESGCKYNGQCKMSNRGHQ